MGFNSVRAIAASADEDGANWTSWIHKSSGPTPAVTGTWNDLSMGAGIPKYNAYVGGQLEATQLNGSGNNGIYLGPTPSTGQTKNLLSWGLQVSGTGFPIYAMLCDYLLFYPLIDGDSTDLQEMIPTAVLPRYTDGNGVRCMAVVTTPMAVNANVSISYTNQAGVSGRTSSFQLQAATTVGSIISNGAATNAGGRGCPFIPLQSGDTGIRSIEGVTNATGAGGFYALALVKPLSSLQVLERYTWSEINHLQHKATLPVIQDGAYVNIIYNSAIAGTSALVRGFIQVIWR